MTRPISSVMDAALDYFASLENPEPTDAPVESEKAFNNSAKIGRGGSSAGFYGGGSAFTYHKALPAYLGGQGPGGWSSMPILGL